MGARVRWRCIIALPVFGRRWHPQGLVIIDGVKSLFYSAHSINTRWAAAVCCCSKLFGKPWLWFYCHAPFANKHLHLFPIKWGSSTGQFDSGVTLRASAVKTRLPKAFRRQQCTSVPTRVRGCKHIMSPQRRYYSVCRQKPLHECCHGSEASQAKWWKNGPLLRSAPKWWAEGGLSSMGWLRRPFPWIDWWRAQCFVDTSESRSSIFCPQAQCGGVPGFISSDPPPVFSHLSSRCVKWSLNQLPHICLCSVACFDVVLLAIPSLCMKENRQPFSVLHKFK